MKTMKATLTIISLVLMFSFANAENQVTASMREIAKSHIDLGIMYAKTGDYLEATAEFEEALQYDPQGTYCRATVSTFYYELGMIYIYSADGQGSIKFFNRALFLDPANINAQNGLAVAYVVMAQTADEKGDMTTAKKYLAQAMEINPDLDINNAFAGPAESFTVIGNVDQLNTDFAITYSLIANEYFSEGSYQQAKEYYEKALQLAPDYAKAQTGLEKSTAQLASN